MLSAQYQLYKTLPTKVVTRTGFVAPSSLLSASMSTAKNAHPAKPEVTGAEPALKKQKTDEYVLYYVSCLPEYYPRDDREASR